MSLQALEAKNEGKKPMDLDNPTYKHFAEDLYMHLGLGAWCRCVSADLLFTTRLGYHFGLTSRAFRRAEKPFSCLNDM